MTILQNQCARCAKLFTEDDSTITTGDPLLAFPQPIATLINELALRNGTPLSIVTPEGNKTLYPIMLHTRCVVELAQSIMKLAQEQDIDPAKLGFETMGNMFVDDHTEEQVSDANAAEQLLLDPEYVITKLDEHVIGQDIAKQVLAVALSDHLKRLHIIDRDDDVIPKKSNVLLVGPSGSGKTELAERLARLLNVPFAAISATELSPVGIKGTDTSDMVKMLIDDARGDIALAESGIIFIDEVDKIRSVGDADAVTDNVRRTGVQQGLLKFLEGASIEVKINPSKGESALVRTENILVIMGGAFEGLAEMIAKKNNNMGSIGFSGSGNAKADSNAELPDIIEPEHLIEWGYSKEFVGRIPFTATLKALTESDLVRILTEPKEAIVRQFQALCKEDDVELTFSPQALKAIARTALKKKVNARGLRGILEQALFRTRITLRRKKRENPTLIGVHITEDVISSGAPAEYVFSEPPKKQIAKAAESALHYRPSVCINKI